MKKYFLISGAVIVSSVIVFYFFSGRGQIYELSGNITGVADSSISVEGLFTGAAVPRGYGALEEARLDLSITPDSIIKRVEIKIPEPVGEPFYVDEQPKTETSATVENIKDDYGKRTLGIIAKFKRSSWNPFGFEIIDLEYRMLVL